MRIRKQRRIREKGDRKTMKKLFAWMAVMCLLMAAAVQPAAADTVVKTTAYDCNNDERDDNWKYATLIQETGNIVVQFSDGYGLVDRDGNRISDVYQEMNELGYVCRVVKDGKTGIIDAGTGQVLVPCEYDYADNLGSDGITWLAGYRLLPTGTEENNDFYSVNYSTNTRTYYLIDSTDFYYNGTKVGALSRSEFTNSYRCYVKGSYLLVNPSDSAGNTMVYSPDFSVRALSERTTSEYDYNNVHCGTGQAAFAPGCTLTADEVESSVLCKDNGFYDLQGNLLFAAQQPYDYCDILNQDYIRVSMDGKYGIIDMQGNTVIPCTCDRIDHSDHPFPGGYQAVSLDDKIAFYNTRGEVTCPPVYAYSAASVDGPFATLKDLMGGVIVLSGAVGELPGRYADVQINYFGSARCFAAQKNDGTIGVVDLFGNELIPFGDSFRYMSDISISYDGTVILAYTNQADGQYIVYQIALSDDDAAEITAVSPVQEAQNDDSWTCPSCGQEGLTSNFCPNCGSPRP